MSTARQRSLFASLLGIILVVSGASELAAQTRLAQQDGAFSSPELAHALHQRAADLFMRPPMYPAAAALLVQAADLRDPADPDGIRELIVAAKLYSYAQRNELACEIMERAAARSLDAGNVLAAAHAYIDAAFLAIVLKDAVRARALSARAERLSASSHLTERDRTAILSRINPDRLRGGGL